MHSCTISGIVHDSGHPVDVIYLDFQKAFDMVPHRRLITKLEVHGIDGDILQWTRNWLSDRKQRVVLQGQFLDLRDVLSVVPQGSVLDPLMFRLRTIPSVCRYHDTQGRRYRYSIPMPILAVT